ncbi:ATP-binding protein [Pseudodesulfovibrio sp. zrk46]|uniref:ATP-binding protein n=1 Tax=Pseudodesulfovibrio sp. zrk46 TaxID=2725288 RepID=UPI00144986C5|nr:ATP-binding protein [Pseudodesulfovibrio sp. zrk46]QJB55687.1 response regulator [Pseudodesulfovibrio sp. zrk46]
MRILILAGKQTDELILTGMLGDSEFTLARYAEVSRGVRRLESGDFDMVFLMPDEKDSSWERALLRIKREHLVQVVLLRKCTDKEEVAAFEAGAFDVLSPSVMAEKCTSNSIRILLRHAQMRDTLHRERSMVDWLEETARIGYWEMDEDGKTEWSGGMRRILGDEGYLTEDFLSIRRFVHPDDLGVYDQANKATLEQGWPLDFEYRVETANEEIRHLHVHRRVEVDAAGKRIRAYGMVRDVTPEREFEEFLLRRDAILQVVGKFANRFLRDSDWESGMDASLEALGKAADVTRIYIFRKHEGRARTAPVSMVYEWAAPGIQSLIDHSAVQEQTFEVYSRWRSVLIGRKVIAGNISDFQTEERQFFEKIGTKAIMMVPVFVGNQWWGFIGLSDHRGERNWPPTEIESMTMLADMLGSAILRGHMEYQLKEANRSAEEAKTLALEASKAKSRFLANMSHEIRTPISGILGMTEMTITTGLSPEQREHMDMIRDAARSLLSVVNDILDISKIEADKMELSPIDFEFRSAVETCIRPFGPLADQKNIVFLHSFADDVPDNVHGDPDRLAQILVNLVGNALKFTERGLIELKVEVAERQEDKVSLLFTVRDTGEGIPADKLDDIFDSFTQADSSTRKKHQGTGLGLSICRELVDMMGGEIGVESEPGRGSTFSFSAWFGISAEGAKMEKAAPVAPQTLHLNLLLAEDNPLNQKFLTHFLTMFGHKVTVAGNGLEVLDALTDQSNKFDLILMDIQMPEMGGLEATDAIRKSDGKLFDNNIPIIALTAYAMTGDRDRMLEAGMDDYVSKPVDMKALSAAIARAMESRKPSKVQTTTPKASQVAREKVAADGAGITLDMEALVDRFEGNTVLLKDILELFLIEAAEKLDKLDASLKKRELRVIGTVLHSITNLSSHVLAMDLVYRSRELEKQCYTKTYDEVAPQVAELRPMFEALVEVVKKRAKTL